MFELLGEKLETIFKKLKGQGVITEKNIREAMREIRLALLEADVNFKVVKEFISKVTEKAVGTEVLSSITPGQQIVKIVHDQMIELLGGQVEPFALNQGRMNILVLLGLQGSGKTSFAGKLAYRFKPKGWKPLLVACDIHRPAAIHQLEVVGKQVGVPVFSRHDSPPATKIAAEALRFAEKEARDVVIIDTAGRLHIDEMKMDEVITIKGTVKPDFTFLVADAMTGQDAVNSARVFNEKVGIDGVCLTKMDGDARGGAALSIRFVTGKPIKFIAVGEKPDALEEFFPDRMASRILGMGDVVTLVEKAQEAFDEKRALEMQKKLRRQTFTFQDFLDQMRQVKKMGSFKDIISLIPGIGRELKNVDLDEHEFKRVEAIIQSMTAEERDSPYILNASRRERIALGSGTSVPEINQLIKQFGEAQKMMKRFFSSAAAGPIPGLGPLAGPSSHRRAKKKKKRKKKR